MSRHDPIVPANASGEAINARATAGALVVEARWRLQRAEAQARSMRDNAYHALARRGLDVARDALAVAEINYAAALGVEYATPFEPWGMR